jgi:hypothetical protein
MNLNLAPFDREVEGEKDPKILVKHPNARPQNLLLMSDLAIDPVLIISNRSPLSPDRCLLIMQVASLVFSVGGVGGVGGVGSVGGVGGIIS